MMANALAAVANMVTQIEAQYPAFAPLLKIPDIAKLLVEASQPGQQWTSTKFQAAIQGTDWWKNTSQPARQWEVLKLVQPGSAAQQQAQVAQQVHSLAATEGVVLSSTDLGNLVEQAQSNGWNANQIQQAVGQQARYGQQRAGTIQSTAGALGKIAADYGVPLSDHATFGWAQKIAEGNATQEGFQAYAQDQAKLAFPTLAQHIDQGMTVRQLADPYLQIAGQTLGVDPNTLELNNPKWASALQSRDAKGNITGPMTQMDWQRKIMTDPTYGYDHSQNAIDAATNLVASLKQSFGNG